MKMGGPVQGRASLKSIYHGSYHGIPEHEQAESCRAQCLWENAEHTCWLCDGGGLLAAHPALAVPWGHCSGVSGRLMQHPWMPGALQE